MSAPHISLSFLPSLCQHFLQLVEIWQSSEENNLHNFFETRCRSDQRGHGSDVPQPHPRCIKQIMSAVIVNVCCVLFRAHRAVVLATVQLSRFSVPWTLNAPGLDDVTSSGHVPSWRCGEAICCCCCYYCCHQTAAGRDAAPLPLTSPPIPMTYALAVAPARRRPLFADPTATFWRRFRFCVRQPHPISPTCKCGRRVRVWSHLTVCVRG